MYLKPCLVLLVVSLFLSLYALSQHGISRIWRRNTGYDKKQEFRPTYLKKKSDEPLHMKTFSIIKPPQAIQDNQTTEAISHEKEAQQTARLTTLHDTCKSTKRNNYDVINSPPFNLYVDLENKLMYCNIPKIASTNWKRVLLVLAGKMKTTESKDQQYVNRLGKRQLTLFKDLSLRDRKVVMETYIKFLFVRHPFSRLLSAFKNKLEPNSTFERARFWQERFSFVTQKYRKYNRSTRLVENRTHKYDLTFAEFVKFIIDENTKHQNIHWREMHMMCLPCNIPYTFIGNFETLESDAEYLLTLAKVNNKVHFPPRSSSSPTNSSDDSMLSEYFHDVPENDIQALYKKYQLDFKLFGYNISKFLTKTEAPDKNLMELT